MLNRNQPIFDRHKSKPKPAEPAEDRLLKAAMAAKIPVCVYLINGDRYEGLLTEVAKFSVELRPNTPPLDSVMLMKHAIVKVEAHRA